LHLTGGWHVREDAQVLVRFDGFSPDVPAGRSDWLVLGFNVWPTRATEVQVNYIVDTGDAALDRHQLLVNYQDEFYFPFLVVYPEAAFGGDFETEADYADEYVRGLITQGDNWVIDPLVPFSFNTINFITDKPNPAAPSSQNLFGTDDRGRDVLSRLVY